jgi:hypothetical protein
MAFTKTVDNCTQYWNPDNDNRGVAWAALDESTKKGCFNRAKRSLELWLGRELNDPDDDWTYGPRDDYALYEQALYFALNSSEVEGTKPNRVSSAKRREEKASDRVEAGPSPDARRWLCISATIIRRG